VPSEFAALYGAKKGVLLGAYKRGNCFWGYGVPNAMGRAGRVGRGAWGRAGQGRAGQGRQAGQGRAGQGRAGRQGRAMPERKKARAMPGNGNAKRPAQGGSGLCHIIKGSIAMIQSAITLIDFSVISNASA